MRYLLLGLVSGIIFSLVPIWTSSGAVEIYPEWHSDIDSINYIEGSPNSLLPDTEIPLINHLEFYLISLKGKLLKKINFDNHLISISNNGAYYAQYDKTGSHVELLNTIGDKFWRIKSREYPYVSSTGKIILLMNGDHSRIRIMDINGNPAGATEIHGALCTVIALSHESDYSGLGFLNGSYYLMNDKGEIINNGTTPDSSIVKGIAISANGNYFVIHYGNRKGDFLRLINNARNKHYTLQLKHIHLTKTAISVKDNGNYAVIDYDRIIICADDKIERILKIPLMSPGLSSINFINNMYFASYTNADGHANFCIFLDDGTFLFHKIFFKETFIESRIHKNTIFLQGSENLFCYSLLMPDDD
ncbi:MAG: hypothetical protein JXN64_13025 [Spirochaetes bacterium]|nr:hypothetical protein [Spirochaetota bacterium]